LKKGHPLRNRDLEVTLTKSQELRTKNGDLHLRPDT
jgi:hypothetical protein